MEEQQNLHESTESASPVTHSESDSPPATSAAAGGGETVAVPVNMPATVAVDSSGKKKRGRPRKYDSDGNLRVPIVKSIVPPPPGFTLSSSSAANRPSGNWNVLASSLGGFLGDTVGADFTPHVVNVLPGEDVAGKILSISQKGPLGICVLSANGVVSNVTLRQPGSAGGILTYEGRFEILSLSGSFTISENGGVKIRNGGLSVSLAGPDGRIIGGGVAGLLLAATPIQIVAGSFVPHVYKIQTKRRPEQHYEHVSAANVVISAIPVSQAAPVINNTVQQNPDVSPLPGRADNGVNAKSTPLSTPTHEWNGTDPAFQRVYPDINASAPE